MVLGTTRLCIPRGTDEDGVIDGSLRKMVTEWIHIPHLEEIKTGRAAEQRYCCPIKFCRKLDIVKFAW